MNLSKLLRNYEWNITRGNLNKLIPYLQNIITITATEHNINICYDLTKLIVKYMQAIDTIIGFFYDYSEGKYPPGLEYLETSDVYEEDQYPTHYCDHKTKKLFPLDMEKTLITKNMKISTTPHATFIWQATYLSDNNEDTNDQWIIDEYSDNNRIITINRHPTKSYVWTRHIHMRHPITEINFEGTQPIMIESTESCIIILS